MLKNSNPVFFKRPTEDRQEISCGRIYTPLDISRPPGQKCHLLGIKINVNLFGNVVKTFYLYTVKLNTQTK
jgi:hypothetical protein